MPKRLPIGNICDVLPRVRGSQRISASSALAEGHPGNAAWVATFYGHCHVSDMRTPGARKTCPLRLYLTLTVLILTSFIYWSWHGDSTAYRGTHTSTLESVSTRGDEASFAAILSMTTSETSYDYMSFSNKHNYAAKHGYDLIWDFGPSLRYLKVWEKLNMTRDAITSSLYVDKSYQWVWMLDFDALITNTSIMISDVIEQSLQFAESEGKRREDIHLVLTRDCDPLNLGSMFVRASSWTLDFIEEWRAGADILDNHGQLRNEQDVLRDMLRDNTFSVADHSVIAPQHFFDAYPAELECYDPRDPRPWEPGMFVLHFAGAPWRLKGEEDPVGSLMRRYSHMIV